MKIKLKNHQELAAVCEIIIQLFDISLNRAKTLSKDGVLSIADIHHRLVTFELLFIANAAHMDTLKHRKQPAVKFTPPAGLALLAAWYTTDATELDMSPLGAAVFGDIIAQLEKQFTGPVVVER